MPHFLLAVAIIVVFRISWSLDAISSFVGVVWRIFSPFFWGIVIAFILNVPTRSIQKIFARSKRKFLQKHQRIFAVILTLVILLALVATVLAFTIPAIISSVVVFVENIDDYWAGVVGFIDTVNSWDILPYINEELIFAALGDFFADFSIDNLTQPFAVVISIGTFVVDGAIGLALALISSVYILFDKDRAKAALAKTLHAFTPKVFAEGANAVGQRLSKNFRVYIQAQTIDGIILGTIAGVALWIIGSPFALVLGIMLGVFNYVPILGSLVGSIIAVIVVMFTQDFTTGLIAAGVLLVIQQLDANVIQPRLMSTSFPIRPLVVIVAVTVGNAVAGIFGMVAAIPIAALLKETWDEATDYFIQRKQISKLDSELQIEEINDDNDERESS